MTDRDKIIRMAREAGLLEIVDDAYRERGDWNPYAERFFRMAYEAGAAHALANIDPSKFMSYQEGFDAGRLAEREACAELCDYLDDDLPDGLAGWQFGEAIRARSKA